ncbi:MAG: hypothetical protein JWQ69_4015 [Pseudomonas sp.]|nr:hypothetical protein [Pseudomonas sp.]
MTFPVGAAEGCEKVGTAFSGPKSATGSRSIAAFGSSYRDAVSLRPSNPT